MRRSLLLFSLMLCVTMGWAQKIVCHIKGECENKQEKAVYLYEHGSDLRVNDYLTIDVVDGKFQYDLESDMLRMFQICLASEYQSRRFRFGTFVVENANVTITIPVRGGNNDRIKVDSDGKEFLMLKKYDEHQKSVNEMYTSKFKELDAYRDSLDSLHLYYLPIVYELKNATGRQRDSLQQLVPAECFTKLGRMNEDRYDETLLNRKIDNGKWFRQNKCFVSLCIMSNEVFLYRQMYPKYVDELSKTFDDCYSDYMTKHPYYEKLNNGVVANRLRVGNKYIDYDVRNYEGNTAKISSLYKGKLIYIDMWASWCGPCRKHAKELIPVYEKYKDRGFQIIAIARENTEGVMERAMKHDGYPWPSLLDLKDEHSVWRKNGLGNGGGGGYLIDADGTILAIYPEAEETERILKEKLGE